MNIRFNPIPAGSLQAFANLHSRCLSGVQQVCFVRVTGCSRTIADEIRKMDAQLSADPQVVYLRLTALPEIPASLPERTPAPAVAEALAQIRALLMHLIPPPPEQTRRALLAGLAYRAEQALLPTFGDASGSFRKLAVSGITDWQDYLFCALAAQMGIDTLVFLPGLSAEIPQELLVNSAELRIGPAGEYDIPPFSVAMQIPPRPQAPYRTPQIPPRPQAQPRMPEIPPRPQAQPRMPEIPPRPQAPSRTQQNPTYAGGVPMNSSRGVQVHFPQRSTGGGTPNRGVEVRIPRPERTASIAPPPPVRTPRTFSSPFRRTPPPQLTFEDLAALARSVVMIAIRDKTGDVVATGSGIMIGREGYILTNCHVVEKAREFSVRIENDDRVYSTDTVVKYHTTYDLAIIRIARELTPLDIYDGREELVRGQRVAAIGSPMGMFNSVSDGIISGFRVIDGCEHIQFTAPISHGSSGGALLNTSGEVIGISSGGIRGAQNLNLAVSYTHILDFAKNFLR